MIKHFFETTTLYIWIIYYLTICTGKIGEFSPYEKWRLFFTIIGFKFQPNRHSSSIWANYLALTIWRLDRKMWLNTTKIRTFNAIFTGHRANWSPERVHTWIWMSGKTRDVLLIRHDPMAAIVSLNYFESPGYNGRCGKRPPDTPLPTHNSTHNSTHRLLLRGISILIAHPVPDPPHRESTPRTENTPHRLPLPTH